VDLLLAAEAGLDRLEYTGLAPPAATEDLVYSHQLLEQQRITLEEEGDQLDLDHRDLEDLVGEGMPLEAAVALEAVVLLIPAEGLEGQRL
jgi:hypothetical protein